MADDPGPEKNLADPPGSSGILAPFNAPDEYGAPMQVYTVNVDTGSWDDFDLKIWGFLTSLFFTIAKWLVGFVCWLVTWALNFGLAKIMVTPVADISGTIRDQVINRLGLPGLFLTFAALFAGWHILFRQRSRGFAEAGISLVVAAIATTVLLAPAQVLLGTDNAPAAQGSDMLLSNDGVVGKAKDLSLQVSNLVLSQDPGKSSADPTSVSSPITTGLVNAFVVMPTELMTYGKIFTGDCAKAYSTLSIVAYNASNLPSGQVLETRYMNQINDAANKFKDACKTKDFSPRAQKASADTTFSALFVVLAAIICVILITLVSGGFLVAQGWVAFEAIRAPWALTVGILPGGGRATLWRWVAALIKAVLAVVLSVLFLAIFILMILALLKSDTGSVLAVKFVSIDLVAVAGLAGHKKIKETARQVAVGINRKLANAKVGGVGRSAFATPGRCAETALSQADLGRRPVRGPQGHPAARQGRTHRQGPVGRPASRTTRRSQGRAPGQGRARRHHRGHRGRHRRNRRGSQGRSAAGLEDGAHQAPRRPDVEHPRRPCHARRRQGGGRHHEIRRQVRPPRIPCGLAGRHPRGAAAAKRGASTATKKTSAAMARVETRLGGAAKKQWGEARAFGKEYADNSRTAGRAVRRGAKFVASSVWDSSGNHASPSAMPKKPTPGPARPPATPTTPAPAPAAAAQDSPGTPPAGPPRPRRRATRPAGPAGGGRP
ncbi:hypothetical protein GCM10025734_01410 [Kitasatospora paranensis]|uniref:hypothetical protein n=1 Tax=Kitasatospora paranensis TaxID=258053 RepID=UPI0031EA9C1B